MPLPGFANEPTSLAALMAPTSFEAVESLEDYILAAPNKPFFLQHHPSAWRMSATLEEPTWLPELTKFVIQAGVNQVRVRKSDEPPFEAYRRALIARQEQGYTILRIQDHVPAHLLPDGVAPGPYIRDLKCRHPKTDKIKGVFFVEAWQVPVQTPFGEPQKFRWDLEKYERWLLHLLQTGVIQPPMETAVERQIERKQWRVDRAMQDERRGERAKEAHIRRAQAELEQYAGATLYDPKRKAEAPAQGDAEPKAGKRGKE